ncbi:hypothetical protein P9112_002370 [Eukaryota sp. TZLM1-RC]
MLNEHLNVPSVKERFATTKALRTVLSLPESSSSLINPQHSHSGCNGTNLPSFVKVKGPSAHRSDDYDYLTQRCITLLPVLLQAAKLNESQIQSSLSLNSTGWVVGWIFLDSNGDYCLSIPSFDPPHPPQSHLLNLTSLNTFPFILPSMIVLVNGTLLEHNKLSVTRLVFPPPAPLPYPKPNFLSQVQNVLNNTPMVLWALKFSDFVANITHFTKQFSLNTPDVVILYGPFTSEVCFLWELFALVLERPCRLFIVPTLDCRFRIIESFPASHWSLDDVLSFVPLPPRLKPMANAIKLALTRAEKEEKIVFCSNPFTIDVNFIRMSLIGVDLDSANRDQCFSVLRSQRVLYPVQSIEAGKISRDVYVYCGFCQSCPNLFVFPSESNFYEILDKALFVGVSGWLELSCFLPKISGTMDVYDVDQNVKIRLIG